MDRVEDDRHKGTKEKMGTGHSTSSRWFNSVGAHSCNCAGYSRKVHIMYKLVYNSDKRIIVFKNALQLARYLRDVKSRTFRLYKKG